METDRDHIYILLQYNPDDSITRIARTLKQCSTYHAWKRHAPLLRHFYWKEHTLWSDGYFACTVGNASTEVVAQYIASQG